MMNIDTNTVSNTTTSSNNTANNVPIIIVHSPEIKSLLIAMETVQRKVCLELNITSPKQNTNVSNNNVEVLDYILDSWIVYLEYIADIQAKLYMTSNTIHPTYKPKRKSQYTNNETSTNNNNTDTNNTNPDNNITSVSDTNTNTNTMIMNRIENNYTRIQLLLKYLNMPTDLSVLLLSPGLEQLLKLWIRQYLRGHWLIPYHTFPSPSSSTTTASGSSNTSSSSSSSSSGGGAINNNNNKELKKDIITGNVKGKKDSENTGNSTTNSTTNTAGRELGGPAGMEVDFNIRDEGGDDNVQHMNQDDDFFINNNNDDDNEEDDEDEEEEDDEMFMDNNNNNNEMELAMNLEQLLGMVGIDGIPNPQGGLEGAPPAVLELLQALFNDQVGAGGGGLPINLNAFGASTTSGANNSTSSSASNKIQTIWKLYGIDPVYPYIDENPTENFILNNELTNIHTITPFLGSITGQYESYGLNGNPISNNPLVDLSHFGLRKSSNKIGLVPLPKMYTDIYNMVSISS